MISVNLPPKLDHAAPGVFVIFHTPPKTFLSAFVRRRVAARAPRPAPRPRCESRMSLSRVPGHRAAVMRARTRRPTADKYLRRRRSRYATRSNMWVQGIESWSADPP
ncbi:hypothetical protein EVAR_47421_1 [Eumeta japonica]|uniref:Uncharacterized protein n=1 Tax=Eumeta variegata TaxID=151549 RepID=A0A4C1XZS8_EUMVA|nr:hypothetical protein EVAR_47421_1 [Eumeta japonica]